MKRILSSSAVFAALTLSCFAGTDSAPMATTDSKDMKDVKQMATTESSDAGFYVGALGGANFDTDYGDRRETRSTPGGSTFSTHAPMTSDWAGVGGIKLGYNFNSYAMGDYMKLRLQPAVEVEALYIGDNETVSDNPVTGRGTFSSNSGDFFINGILRFRNRSIITPYVGIGAGLQYITTHGDFAGGVGSNRATGVNTSDLDFAAQAIYGVDVAVTSHWTLFSEYKFIDAIGNDGKSGNFGGSGDTYRLKGDQIMQNLITAGVKYNF